MPQHFDAIIIGTGAGGGTLARALAPSGLRILLLERGHFLPREPENWDPHAVFSQQRYLAPDTWYDADDRPFRPYTHYCVGGNTKVYGAALLRLRSADFGVVRHYGGDSPAWAISYQDLEPYYARAEAMYSVHGLRGADPTEPPASGPFPHPPVDPEPRIATLRDDLAREGLRPFPVPLGVRLDHADRAAAPYRLARFDGYPDLTEVKADAHVVGVRPALARPNVTLWTDAFVERLNTNAAGTDVTEVVVRRGGERVAVRSSIVVLAAGAINSAAILLRSTSSRHPDGLANSSGLVGRNYMCHQNGCLVAVNHAPNPSAFQKHFAIADFYHGDPREGGPPLGLVQLMGKPDPDTLRWLMGDRLPGLSPADIAPRTFDFFLTAEDLPDPDNRVSLRPDGSIRLTYRRNNTRAYDALLHRFREALLAVDRRRGEPESTVLHERLGISGVSHQNGTMRFGRDPASSVLDPDCKSHDLDNLYVADASFFPSSAAVNPSLTIMANALRVGDIILERLGARAAQAPAAVSAAR